MVQICNGHLNRVLPGRRIPRGHTLFTSTGTSLQSERSPNEANTEKVIRLFSSVQIRDSIPIDLPVYHILATLNRMSPFYFRKLGSLVSWPYWTRATSPSCNLVRTAKIATFMGTQYASTTSTSTACSCF